MLENKKCEYYYGEKISDYGLEHGYVDYRTFAKALGDMVLNNDLFDKLVNLGYDYEFLSGEFEEHYYYDNDGNEYSDEEYEELEDDFQEELEDDYRENEVYQWYVISGSSLQISDLQRNNEICVYFDEFDLTLWGVTHWGTSWDCVLTSIPCREEV